MSDGLLGCFSPISHLRTVDGLVLRTDGEDRLTQVDPLTQGLDLLVVIRRAATSPGSRPRRYAANLRSHEEESSSKPRLGAQIPGAPADRKPPSTGITMPDT